MEKTVYLLDMFRDYEPPEELRAALSQAAVCHAQIDQESRRITVILHSEIYITNKQLSETERYRRQFALLQKLGMARREMARALRAQFSIYYALPAVPPVLIGVPFILHLAGLPEPGVMVGASSPPVIAATALAVFFLVYAVYILLAYTSLKRNVPPG